MPSARHRALGLPLAWAVGALAVIGAGFLDDPYLQHVRRMEGPVDYPSGTVAGLVGLMAVHAGLLHVILRPSSGRTSRGRALAAWVLAIGLLFAMAMASIHAPPALLACLGWLAAIALATTGVFAVSAWRAWRSHRSGNRAP